MDEDGWLDSSMSLDLRSSLIRTGKNEVFAESPEMEVFSLMVGAPLAIFLPGACQRYPQSACIKTEDNAEYLFGICSGNHYYLAVPKIWIDELQEPSKGIAKVVYRFNLLLICYASLTTYYI